MRSILKEMRSILTNPMEGIRVHFQEDNVSNIVADIDGPVDTPFQGGVFRCKLTLSSQFPAVPPKGTFLTKIFHPNVSKTGEICVNTLKKDWDSSLGIKHVLMVIRCLLIHPNPESALNEEAGKLLLEQYEDYAKRAELMTKIHATAKRTDSDGAVSTSASEESSAANSKAALAAVSTKNDLLTARSEAKSNQNIGINSTNETISTASVSVAAAGGPALIKTTSIGNVGAATAAAKKKAALRRL